MHEVVMVYEKADGRQEWDVHKKNLGSDVRNLNHETGEFRLIAV